MRSFARTPPTPQRLMTIDASRLRYDARSGVLSYDATADGDAAFDTAIARALSKIGRDGSWDGNEVRGVRVGFASDAAAERNVDALGFLKIASVGPSGTAKAATFSTRSDFGVED